MLRGYIDKEEYTPGAGTKNSARARRAAQAKQIQANAEVEVANKMAQASKILATQEGGFHLREIQNLAEMSKEESSMIIVYPYKSASAERIAHAAVSLTQKLKPAKSKPATSSISKTASTN